MQKNVLASMLNHEKANHVIGINGIQKQLLEIYQTRMRSLIEIVKVYQQNYEKDNLDGALAYMKTQQFGKYRIDREIQLLKDALLIQKQKLVIKVLTSFHQVKRQNETLKKQQNFNHKNVYSKNSQQNVAQKDVVKGFIQKQNVLKSKIHDRNTNSNSRISVHSHVSNQTSLAANTHVYQKILQQKIIAIKQLQKNNRLLLEQNQVNVIKIKQFQLKIKQIEGKESQRKSMMLKACEQNLQCKECKTLKEKVKTSEQKLQMLKTSQQSIRLKIVQKQTLLNAQSQQITILNYRIKQLQQLKQRQQKQVAQLKIQSRQKQIQRQLQKKKQKQASNTELIKQLKNQIISMQQQIMVITNAFNLIKQDLSQSLWNEVKRLKNSHQLLKQNIKTYLSNIKTQMMQWIVEMFSTIKLKMENIKNKDQIVKKLRKMDNQLDYFLELKNIQV